MKSFSYLANASTFFCQKNVPDQLINVIDSTFDSEELIYAPLKTFPEDFTEEQKLV